MKETRRFKEWK